MFVKKQDLAKMKDCFNISNLIIDFKVFRNGLISLLNIFV